LRTQNALNWNTGRPHGSRGKESSRPELVSLHTQPRGTPYLELLLGDMTQLDGAGETLVLLGIVVLQTDLEVDGLDELTLLFLGAIKDGVDTLVKSLL